MTKPVKQTIGHKLKLRLKSIKIDKRLIYPIVIDESEMTQADIKNANAYNRVFWGLFALMGNLGLIWYFPARMAHARCFVYCASLFHRLLLPLQFHAP